MSARGNALVLDSTLPGAALLRVLNGIEPEIFFSDATEVDASFRVRAADERTYRYWEPGVVADAPGYRRGVGMLTGRLDVRSFGRGLASGAPVWRDIRRLSLLPESGGAWVEVVAPSFVWGMVRKMISTLRALGEGTIDPETVRAAVEGGRRLTLPLAEPEPLVLWDVRFPRTWSVHADRYSRRQQAYWSAQRRDWSARGPVISALSSAIDRTPPG